MPEEPGTTRNGATPARIQTGSPQTDDILGGGLPANSITILMGQPGTGKTILAEQLLFHNADENTRALYLTTLSEPLSKVVTYLQTFAFFDETRLGTAIVYDDVGSQLAEHGIGFLVQRVRDAIRTTSPKLLVIDSFKVVHDLTHGVSETRLLVSELAGLLSAYEITTLLVGEYSEEQMAEYPEFAIADGIVQLARRSTSRRDERYLRVFKLRGSSYREGLHAFRITESGLDVHPRLITPAAPPSYRLETERVSTGVEGLDTLTSGGLWRGSNTLVIGDAGTGKTTLGLCFAAEGARTGESSLYLNFQENPTQLARTVRGLGFEISELQREGLLFRYSSPVELQIDSIVVDLFETVRTHGIRRVVIDALGDLAIASGDAERFHDYIYALVQHFSTIGVTSLMMMEGSERSGVVRSRDALRLSSIADGIIAVGVDFSGAKPRRTLRVAKLRGTRHDLRPHELIIHAHGLRVVAPEVV